MNTYIDFSQIKIHQQTLIQEAAERRLAAQVSTKQGMATRIGEWLCRYWIKVASHRRRQQSQPVKVMPHV